MSTARGSATRRRAKAPRRRGRRPQAAPLRDARDAAYRQHIMDVAERIFAEQGFAPTRMQDIAAAAGVSLATLYQAYPGKEQLHRAVLVERDRQMLEQLQSRWGHALQAPESVEQVLFLMETPFRFLLGHPDYLRMQLHTGYAWYDRAAQPTVEEQRMWDRGLEYIEAVLAWGAARGVFSAGRPSDQARVLIAAQQTRLANWVTDGMRRPAVEVVAELQADFVRLCGRPALIRELLSDDGAGLSDATRARLQQLAEESP